ncbi:MAG TPA: hypothetical protein VMT96_00625 [Candidatus Bathyarchaeia archaeon]|nr:hypothetical protein [Candidatus Bathyarchaeia archaeon]
MDQDVPEVRFDPERAVRIFPRPVAKHAVLVPIPLTESGSEIPTFILAEWGDLQVFYGSYYGIVQGGEVIYGSAKDQWENMHSPITPGYWVKTSVPRAYRATEPCRIVTMIPSDDDGIREANFVLKVDDLIVRQPGGEVQHIKAEKFEGIYYTDDEAVLLGLIHMTDEQFAAWAVEMVRELVPSN